MSVLPPLRFKPILREALWGGRRLAELGKPLGGGENYSESWEIVDHGADQSVVVDGPLAGAMLHELVTDHGESLLGRHHGRKQFPLLVKFLDCQRTLSVQVHPNDAQAARLNPPDSGKTEAWVILAAERGSKIYAGLKPGVDRSELERAVAKGECEKCLQVFEPKVGDCVFIEAGTVHALGAGLLIAEFQQASDTTFRLFDWNRVDRDGRPRPLHIQESLDTIDYRRGPVNPIVPCPGESPHVERLVACDKFILDRLKLEALQQLDVYDRFHILTVIDGDVGVYAGVEQSRLRRGDTLLIPACTREVQFVPQGRAVLLDMYLPKEIA
ncbi:MAG TPA: type I phosphomannose isomerase catalytic subunit [Lacipirellulaceae bacterium]